MTLVSALLWLQADPPPLLRTSQQFVMVTAVFALVVITALLITIRAIRKANNASVKDQLASEFAKQKETLLLVAQQKKSQREQGQGTAADEDSEASEQDLLKAGVNPADAIGKTCPLCHLEIFEDNEIVIDPYTGAAYHFSAFLNDWPPNTARPKYVYRHPEGEVILSSELVRDF